MIDPIKPEGWTEPDTLTIEQINQFQDAIVKAMDGVGGGSYVLAKSIFMSGKPMIFTQRADQYVHNWPLVASGLTGAEDVAELVYTGIIYLVVAGGDGVVSYSLDGGGSWTLGNFGASLGDGKIRAIASDGTKLVAGFVDTSLGSPFKAQLALSVDGGGTWARKNLGTGDADGVGVVEYDATTELFWAGTQNTGNVETSPDGDTWTTAPCPAPFIAAGPVYGIGFSPTRVIAVKGYAKYAVSDDAGASWSELAWPSGVTEAGHIVYDPVWEIWIACTNLGVYTSDSGDEGTWDLVTPTSINKVGRAPGLALGIINDTGLIDYTTDEGATWLARGIPGLTGHCKNLRYLPITKRLAVIGTDCVAFSIAAAG